jgi:hypothetical protein
LITKFKALLAKYSIAPSVLEDAKRVLSSIKGDIDRTDPEQVKAKDVAYEASRAVTYGSPYLVDVGHPLFLTILQSLSLPPALRRKVEMCAKVYAKVYKPRRKSKTFADIYLEYISHYEAYFPPAQTHLAIAEEALSQGKEHSEATNPSEVATKIRVGEFTLVNTGGFPEKTMAEVGDLIQKASALLKSSGFGVVCYGDILVTNTINRSKVLAFYQIAEDELLVRANFKSTTEILRTVLHELGHRYQFQFMKGRDRDIAALYRRMAGEEDNRYRDNLEELKPQKGDTIEVKGTTWEAIQVLPTFGRLGLNYKITLQSRDDPKMKGSIPLEGWLDNKGLKLRDPDNQSLRGFITEYAKRGGPDENFAEMFSFYCLGKMRKDYREAFEALVFGSSKTAQVRRLLGRLGQKA